MNYKLEPFDIEKAKAGAKVVWHDNTSVEIVTLQGRGDYPVIGYVGKGGIASTWTKDGKSMPVSHYDPVIFLSVPTFPDPPEGEAWHNPHNLTPEQVGDGYRLLLESEIFKRDRQSIIEGSKDGRIWTSFKDGMRGDKINHWRVPASTPFHWDKPKEPVYRPFDGETIQPMLGKAVKAKKGIFGSIIVAYGEKLVRVGLSTCYYDELLENYVMMDGSPCGVLVEN